MDASGENYNIINWDLSVLAFMPLLANHSMVWLQSDCRCDNTPDNLGGEHGTLWWRHNWRNSVSNHQPHHCLLNRLFNRRSKNTSKLRVTGLCVGNSPGTGEFPAEMASNTENASIWWRHHAVLLRLYVCVATWKLHEQYSLETINC